MGNVLGHIGKLPDIYSFIEVGDLKFFKRDSTERKGKKFVKGDIVGIHSGPNMT